MGSARWQAFRRVITFLLGVTIIIDALWDRTFVVAELIIGMICIGVLPIDDFLRLIRRNGRTIHPGPPPPDR